VRGVLSALLAALGRPIGHGCWVDPMMRGRGDTSGGVPERRDPARLGVRNVGEDGASAPRRSRAGT